MLNYFKLAVESSDIPEYDSRLRLTTGPNKIREYTELKEKVALLYACFMYASWIRKLPITYGDSLYAQISQVCPEELEANSAELMKNINLSKEMVDVFKDGFEKDDISNQPGGFFSEVVSQYLLTKGRFANVLSRSLSELVVNWCGRSKYVVLSGSGVNPLQGLLSDLNISSGSFHSEKNIRVCLNLLNLDAHICTSESWPLRKCKSEKTDLIGLADFNVCTLNAIPEALEELPKDFTGNSVFVTTRNFGISMKDVDTRLRLIETGRLYAVVDLPSGIMSGLNIPASLYLVGDIASKYKEVRMVRLSDEKYWEPRPSRRGLRVLSKAGQAVVENILNGGSLSECERTISAEALRHTGAFFSVERYVVASEVVESVELLERFNTKLGQVADLIRPVPLKYAENLAGDEYFEVGNSDINLIGVIEKPLKCVYVNPSKASKGFEKMQLRRGDIVFYLKGVVGVCGLVDEVDGRWIASQSAVVIRLREDSSLPADVLLRYLRTDVVAQYISSVAYGTSVRYMSVKSLADLPVPQLSKKEITEQRKLFLRQQELLTSIDKMKLEIQNCSLQDIPANWLDV